MSGCPCPGASWPQQREGHRRQSESVQPSSGAAPHSVRHLRGKFALRKRRNPRLLGGAQARPLDPQASPGWCGRGRFSPRILQVEPLRWSGLPSLFPRGTNGSLRCSAPFGSVSLSLAFWAVDNPHTRKSCLLGPADCSSPTPPSPLPPLPPPSLPPGAPGQLARGQDCHCRCWCGSSCRRRRRCCFWDPDQAPLTPHLLGPSPALPRREGLWRAEGKGRSLQSGPGFPYLWALAGCHWPADTQKSGKELTRRPPGTCQPQNTQ